MITQKEPGFPRFRRRSRWGAGYYTPDYLTAKLEAFRAAGLENLVVCLDESLACADEAVAAPAVVRYKKRIDVAAVIAAADAIRAAPGRALDEARGRGVCSRA